jgi:hypothetical protein
VRVAVVSGIYNPSVAIRQVDAAARGRAVVDLVPFFVCVVEAAVHRKAAEWPGTRLRALATIRLLRFISRCGAT